MNFASTGFNLSSKNSRTPYFSNPLPNLARNYEASTPGARPLANPILPRVFKEEMQPFPKQPISTAALRASISEKRRPPALSPQDSPNRASFNGVQDLTKRSEE